MAKPLVLCLKSDGFKPTLKNIPNITLIELEFNKSVTAEERTFTQPSKNLVAGTDHNGVVHWVSHGMRYTSLKNPKHTTKSDVILYFNRENEARMVHMAHVAALILSTPSDVKNIIVHSCNAGAGAPSGISRLKLALEANEPKVDTGVTINGSTQYNLGMVLKAVITSAIKNGKTTPYESTLTTS
jgi:hypothetical protein